MCVAAPKGGRYEGDDENEVLSGVAGADKVPTSRSFQQQRWNVVYISVRPR